MLRETKRTKFVDKSPDESGLTIEVLSGPHTGEHWEVQKEEVSIGRGSENDIVLDADPAVSRTHLRLIHSDGSWTVKDCDSLNGTNMKIASECMRVIDSVGLYRYCKLQVGNTSMSLTWVD